MKARLLCRLRPGETRSFDLSDGESVIGRDDDLAVSLLHEDVSRRHARIQWDGRSHWLEDLGSTNGTFLNGRRVAKEKLRHLSVLSLGKALELVFLIGGEATQALTRTGILHAFLVRDDADALPYEIAVGDATIGRSAACNIVSESVEVSKVHARLSRTAEKLVLRDLGSANGTFVNGVRVAEALLVDGDLLSVAGDEFRVSVALGAVTSLTTTAIDAGEVKRAAREERETTAPRFSTDWKVRVEGTRDSEVRKPGEDTDRSSLAQRNPALAEEAPLQTVGRIEVRLAGEGVLGVVAGGGSYLLGRSPAAAIRIDVPGVEAEHARIIISDVLGTAFVQGETGPTFKNGQRVLKPDPILDGDELRLGELLLKVSLRRL